MVPAIGAYLEYPATNFAYSFGLGPARESSPVQIGDEEDKDKLLELYFAWVSSQRKSKAAVLTTVKEGLQDLDITFSQLKTVSENIQCEVGT